MTLALLDQARSTAPGRVALPPGRLSVAWARRGGTRLVDLAQLAGVHPNTAYRIDHGLPVQLRTLHRVLLALSEVPTAEVAGELLGVVGT